MTNPNNTRMKKLLLLFALALLLSRQGYALKPASNDDVILHAWCWSFNTIRENMAAIAKAGYTIVQTSPAQRCVTEVSRDKGGGNQLFGHGKWYYQYQPTDWKIGNYQMGTRDDLIALCKEAKRYGVRVIVDVLPNHTAINDCQVEADLDAAVGGHANLYHANGFTEIKDYSDRLQCTTGQMGGLPDVNTENPDFQHYYLTYVNDLLACGVRGFRYDTAKHIGLPSDPKDPKSPQNDFWDVATGRKAVKGLRLALPADSLFIYGEVLQDINVKEKEYADAIGRVTASALGWCIRHALEGHEWKANEIAKYCHPAAPSRLVTWVESHDTYCNDHESAALTDDQIRMGWVFITARQFGTPLFYSRPDGSSPQNIWGNNIVGKKGDDAFRHPEVVAVNMFRKAMHGQPESVTYTNDGQAIMVTRGKKGAAIINISHKPQVVNLRTSLRNGKYKDKVHQDTFFVSRGMLRGTLAPLTSYILYR